MENPDATLIAISPTESEARRDAWAWPVPLMIATFLLLALISLAPDPVVGKMSPIQTAINNNAVTGAAMRFLGLADARFGHLLALLALVVLASVGIYVWCIKQVRTERITLRRLLTVAGICCALLVLTPPLLSRDLFAVGFYGKISVFYHENPYLVTPQKFVGDPWLAFMSTNWKNTPMVYGPVVWLISSAGALIFGRSIAANLVFLKVCMAGAHIANAVLIWHILDRIAPERRELGTLLYAWNPVVIMIGVGGGHNDIIMMAFVLLAFLLLLKERPMLGFASLTLAVLVKYVSLIFMAMYLFHLLSQYGGWKQRLKQLSRYGAVFLGICTVFFLPLWGGLSTFKAMIRSAGKINVLSSRWVLATFLKAIFRHIFLLSEATAASLASALAAVAMGVLFVYIFFHILRRYQAREELGEAWALAIFAFLATAGYVLPWYLIWFMPLLPLMPWDRRSQAMLGVSMVAMYLALDLWP